MAMFPMSQHMVINARCRSKATPRAAAPASTTHDLAHAEGEPQKLSVDGGYYCDVMVRTPQGWRIKERVEEFSYSIA